MPCNHTASRRHSTKFTAVTMRLKYERLALEQKSAVIGSCTAARHPAGSSVPSYPLCVQNSLCKQYCQYWSSASHQNTL